MAEDRIARQVRSGISWNLASAVLVNVARMVVLTVLGRKLSVDDFGVVAAAVTVNTMVFGFRDLGIGMALVQRKSIEPAHIVTTFSVASLGGVILGSAMFLGAPLLADAYHMPRVTDVARLLAVLLVMGGVATVSRAMAQRELRFRAIAAIDTSAYLVGASTSVVLALTVGGPMTLVIGYLIEEALAATAYVVMCPPPRTWRIDRARLKELFDFGKGQTLMQVVGNLATQADNMIVGRKLGDVALGFYARAYELVRFPSQVFTAVVGNVLFPSFARIQDDVDRVGEGFRRGLFANALLLLPGTAWLIVCAPEAIALLIGSKWGSAVLPFRILAVTILFRTSQKLAALVVQARGKSNWIGSIYLAYLGVVIVGTYAGVPWGIAGVAVAVAGAITFVTLAVTGAALRLCTASWSHVARVHLPGLLLAAVVAVVTWPLASYLRAVQWSGSAILGATLGVAIAVSLVGLIVVRPLCRAEFQWLFAQLLRRKAKPRAEA